MSERNPDCKDSTFIQTHFRYLKHNLEALEIVDFLFEKDVISLNEKEIIAKKKTKLSRNEKLLNILLHAPPGRSLDVFLKSLEGKYKYVLERIKTQDGSHLHTLPVENIEKSDDISINKDIDLLLLGKTGNGKSSTGNSILGKEAFETGDAFESITNSVTCHSSLIKGRKVEVVDVPGFKDTRFNDNKENSANNTLSKMALAIQSHPCGYHAFIFVLKYGARLTDEDEEIMQSLKAIFGKNVVKDYCILVLTHGDNFRSNKANKNKNFKQWCLEQPKNFKEILMECENRAVLFDNNTEDPRIKENQVQELISIIDNLQFHGRRYSDIHFKEATETRRIFLFKQQVERTTEEISQKTTILMERIKKSDVLTPMERINELNEISIQCETLKNNVSATENGKPIFKEALHMIDSIEDFIDSILRTAYKQIKKQKALEEHKQNQCELAEKIKNLEVKTNLGFDERRKLEEQIESHKEVIKQKDMEIEKFNKDIEFFTKEKIPSLEKKANDSFRECLYKNKMEIQRLEQALLDRTGSFWKRLKNLFRSPWSRPIDLEFVIGLLRRSMATISGILDTI